MLRGTAGARKPVRADTWSGRPKTAPSIQPLAKQDGRATLQIFGAKAARLFGGNHAACGVDGGGASHLERGVRAILTDSS